MPRRRKNYQTTVWNAGTAVNVFAIPALTFVFLAGGFYFVNKYKFEVYDAAAADVMSIKLHNAGQDEQVKEIQALLTRISSQVDALRNNTPVSGPGSGGGAAVGGSTRQGP
jgi:hypothetical protein